MSVGRKIIRALHELNTAIAKGEPLSNRFRIRKVVKDDAAPGGYRVIKPKDGK